MNELASLAKSKPRSIQYGSFGIGSMPQLNIEALNPLLPDVPTLADRGCQATS